MKSAAGTWGLVAGIDQYDDPSVNPLDGAVADAVAFTDWLLRLGVPNSQILLHASPTARSKRLLRGRAAAAADAAAIDKSILQLDRVRGGTRLIVYFAGHGLYEPTAGRVFLPSDFSQELPTNFGLEQYIKRFLGMRFPRQFLFVDGCQNVPYSESVRQRFSGDYRGRLDLLTPRAGNILVAAYAAALGQLANELNGRGAFTRRLLEGLDLDQPVYPEAIVLDFETGERLLDIRKLVTEYVAPTVADDVRDRTPQTPNIQSLPAESADLVPFFAFEDDEPPGRVVVAVNPVSAVTAVAKVKINIDDPGDWSAARPRPPAQTVDLPFEVHVPIGCHAEARCILRESGWTGTLKHEFEAQSDTELTFNLERSGGAAAGQAVEVRTVDASGNVMANQFDYAEVGQRLGVKAPTEWQTRVAPGVRLEHHETGPVFRLADAAPTERTVVAARLEAQRWSEALLEATPDAVGVEVILHGRAAPVPAPTVRVRLPVGGAEALAGPLTHEDLVWLGPAEAAPTQPPFEAPMSERAGDKPAGWLSLGAFEANPIVEVEPGHVLIRVDLPWGSWSQTVKASVGATVDLRLPSSIGKPPLRVRLRKELNRRELREGKSAYLLGVGRRPAKAVVRDGLWGQRRVTFREAQPRSARWAFASPRAQWLKHPRVVGIATVGPFSFPFLPGRSLGFEQVGKEIRIEPLSDVASAAWDVILSAGLLDALPAERAYELTYRKWEDALLGLAGAYAVYALPADERTDPFLQTVLGNLTVLAYRPHGRPVPDIDLLGAALTARRGGALSPGERSTLESWGRSGAVPVLRWGVPLAIRLVDDGVLPVTSFGRWREELCRIEEAMSSISVWTAWRAQPGK